MIRYFALKNYKIIDSRIDDSILRPLYSRENAWAIIHPSKCLFTRPETAKACPKMRKNQRMGLKGLFLDDEILLTSVRKNPIKITHPQKGKRN